MRYSRWRQNGHLRGLRAGVSSAPRLPEPSGSVWGAAGRLEHRFPGERCDSTRKHILPSTGQIPSSNEGVGIILADPFAVFGLQTPEDRPAFSAWEMRPPDSAQLGCGGRTDYVFLLL